MRAQVVGIMEGIQARNQRIAELESALQEAIGTIDGLLPAVQSEDSPVSRVASESLQKRVNALRGVLRGSWYNG